MSNSDMPTYLLKNGQRIDMWLAQETENASKRTDGTYSQLMSIGRLCIDAKLQGEENRRRATDVWSVQPYDNWIVAELRSLLKRDKLVIEQRYRGVKDHTSKYTELLNLLPETR